MQILIKGHQTDIVERWREHIYDRLTKLARFENRIIKIEYVLTASHHHLKGNEMCQIVAKVPGKTIAIKKTAQTIIEAVDLASKVLEKQIQNLWKDTKDRHRHSKLVLKAKRGMAEGL